MPRMPAPTVAVPAPTEPTHTDQELFAALRWLAEAWCDRRAFAALRIFLPAYPIPDAPAENAADPGQPNPVEALVIALKDVRAFAREDLLESEHLLINDCILVLDRKLNPVR